MRSLLFGLLVFCVLVCRSARAEQVVFSEVMYNPVVGKPEFIEVWNISNTPLDIAKWSFTTGITFTFPDFDAGISQAHFLKGNERIILSAATDAATRLAYPGIPSGVRIFGPWSALTTLDDGGETITLKDRNSVIITNLKYGDDGKWPIAPDGTGHSLVLKDENQAIDDWRVWRASTNAGGSPGVADPAAAATGIALNEIKFRTSDGHVEWVEFRNNSLTTTRSAAGLFVASVLDFSDKIPLSGNLNAGAVVSFPVDFTPDGNGDVRLFLINSSNSVLDAVKIRRKIGRESWQVFPAGSNEWFNDTANTQNAQNNPTRTTDIVINELMVDPPSNQRDGEFVELYNRGVAAVNVGGWILSDAVDFSIPAGTSILPGGYLVIAANRIWLNANNSGLAAIGDWSGNLSNSGDRLQLKDANDNLADEVDYRLGGEWPELAGGNGSSLELVNPGTDNSVGSAWADSNESAKSSFTSFTIDGGTFKNLTVGSIQDTEIRLWLPGDGHIIIRNATIRPTGGSGNLFVSPSVTTLNNNNVDGWQSRGTHWNSYHDAEGVHIVADGHGDNKVNHAEKDAAGMTAATAYTMTFDARWVYGKPRLVAQSWDMSWGGTVLVPIPNNLGTPGAQNSRFVASTPPQVTMLNHSPAVPTTGSTVTVTASVSSNTPLSNVQLWHRLDNINYNGTWTTTTMVDSGTAGDAVAADGIYTAQVPLASFGGYNVSGAIIEFYVKVNAMNGQSAYAPRASVIPEPLPTSQPRTAMWIVDTQSQPTDLRRMRTIISSYWLDALDQSSGTGGHTSKFNFKFPKLANHYFPCTYIHNDSVIYYGSAVRKTGSPFTRTTNSSLDRARVIMPGDRPFRGKNKLYWDNDASGGSMLHNRLHRYWLYLFGVPGNQNEVCRVCRNNGSYLVRETSEVFDKQMLSRIWEDGSDGQFFEMDDKFWIDDDGTTRRGNANGSWDYDPANSPGAENPTSYHNNFTPKSREWQYDYSTLIEWCRQLETNTSITPEQLERMGDTQAMAAYVGVRGYTADWDNFTINRGKNGFFYNRSTDHKWMFIHWDSDTSFNPSQINVPVIGTLTNFGTTTPSYFSKPYVRHYANYYLNQMLTTYAPNGPRITAWITAEENSSSSYSMPATYANWPNTLATSGTSQTRTTVVQNFIGASLNTPFVTTSPANNSAVTSEIATVSGTAPASAFSIICLNHPEALLAWTGTSTADTSPWSLSGIQLRNGANVLTFRMMNHDGAQVGSDISLTINKSNNARPVVVITSDPPSQNVALGEILTVDASGSADPEGNLLSYVFTVAPSSGFALSSPTSASRNLIFSVPGTYTVTVQATDTNAQTTSSTRTYSVYSSSDFDPFNGSFQGSYTTSGLELRDNFSPDTSYTFNDKPGNLLVELTDKTLFPLRQSSPTHPLVTRAIPSSADFVLQTNLTLESRQFGTFQTGLFVQSLESGVITKYAFGLDNGTDLKMYRASGTGAYTLIGSLTYAGGDLTLRVLRVGTTLNFQRRVAGAWVNVTTRTLPSGSTFTSGGIFASSGTVNGSSTSPGQGLRIAFDYLLLADPGNTADLVSSLRITEIMYNPDGAGGVEFIELQNIGVNPINLQGAYFETDNPFSTQFTFDNLPLQPGQYTVVTNDADGFITLYGTGATIAGQFTGSLANGGELIVLKDMAGNAIHDFSYDDVAPWPLTPDGFGPSLEVITTNSALYAFGTNWRASYESGGSPGYLGFATDKDSDGVPDSVELAFGSDPTNATSMPQAPGITRNPTNGDITLTWAGQAGRNYIVQASNDLSINSWQPLATVTALTFTDTTTAGEPRQFYRVVATFP